MRLREAGRGQEGMLIRSAYGHEEAAAAAYFDLISVADSDLHLFSALGYAHRASKRNASSLAEGESISLWTWRAAPLASPRHQPLPLGSRRDTFYCPDVLLDKRITAHEAWNGEAQVPYYLVQWRGYPSADECTWEPSRALDAEVRLGYDRGPTCKSSVRTDM